MSEGKNIYQRINAVMLECPYIQKEKAQQGKGVKYDTVVAMFRSLLIKHGIVMVVRQMEMECINSVSANQKVYQGRYELDLVNMDNPSEIVTHSTYAHGMDGGDKAPGKAQTYAVKIMLVKGFLMETGENEESITDNYSTLTPTQIKGVEALLKGNDDIRDKMYQALGVSDVSEIEKSSYDKIIANIKFEKKNANN